MTMDARVSRPTDMRVLTRARFFLALAEAVALLAGTSLGWAFWPALFAWPAQLCVPRRFHGAFPRGAT